MFPSVVLFSVGYDFLYIFLNLFLTDQKFWISIIVKSVKDIWSILRIRFWKCHLLDPESHVEILDVRKLLSNSKETAVGHVGLEAVGVVKSV